MIKDIIVTNRNGNKFDFDMVNRIVDGLDLSGLKAQVNTIETTSDGSRYQNTRLLNRNFDLVVQLRRNGQAEETMDSLRQRLYTVFSPEQNPIRFDFKDSSGEEYFLEAYSLNAPVMRPDKRNNHSAYQVMLLQFTCPDPFIYQKMDSRFEVATFEGGFEFDLEIPVDGIEMETKTSSVTGNVVYTGNGTSGMVIKFRASATVVNPELTNISTFEKIKLNFTMQTGDLIEISTYKGNRSIKLTRSGVTTNIFYSFVVAESKFLQLDPGDNIFSYSADDGEEYLEVVIDYRIKKVGV